MGVAAANNKVIAAVWSDCLEAVCAKSTILPQEETKFNFFFVMPIEIDSGVKSKAGIPFGRLQQ